MKDKQIDRFSWTALFLVTGFSFFVFSKMLKFLTGSQLPVFTWIGIISLVIGFIISIISFLQKSER